MYLFEAHYTNMDNDEEITRKIEFDGQFMENDKECYMYAMSRAYDLEKGLGAYGSLAYDLKGHEEPLQVIIHFADFWSAQFLEVGKLDRFNDQVKSEETTDEVKEEGENNEE